MNVRELSREQLDELKVAHVCYGGDTSWGEIADAANIPDEVIFERYEGIHFVPDDFVCSVGKEDNYGI